MNPVVHFELPYENAERISKFYGIVFGWKLTNLDEEYRNYVLITTTEKGAKPGMPAGAINSGFFPVKSDCPEQ
jgi:predicted enzyme related to lactoylglutathione lyase